MKKSVLVTSILFSTMMLGTNVFYDNTYVIRASEIKTVQDTRVIDNKIRFLDQDQMPLEINNDKVYTVSGHIGDDINLNLIIPHGYVLHDKNKKLKIEDDGEVRTVILDAQEVTNRVNFKDVKTNKILNFVELKGKVGDIFRFPNYGLPKGFHFDYGFGEDVVGENIILSVDNMEINSWIVADKKEKNVKLKFIDENGEYISEKTIKCPIGEKYYLGPENSFSFQYLPKYELAEDQPIFFAVNDDTETVKIKVKKYFMENILDFKDGDRIVDSFPVEGVIGGEEDITHFIPDEYDLINPNDSNVIIGKDKMHREIQIKKNTFTNTINFKDSEGHIVYSTKVAGKKGSKKNILYELPSDFYLKNDEDEEVVLQDKDSIISVNVLKKVTNKIQYITSSGKEVRVYVAYGKSGDIEKINKIKGFKIIGSKTITINPTEGYTHQVTVEGEIFNTEIIFKEVRYHNSAKEVSRIKYSGRAGDKLPEDLIPKGYILSNRNMLFGNEVTETIWLKKMVKTTVNYRDSFGKLVGKQESTNPDGDNVKLRVPKGYLLVNNASQTFGVDQEHPVQNVLVVPTNGVQVPELPNIVSTQINLINRKDNKVIHSYVAQGIHGQSMNIQIPTGYDLAKGVTNKLTLDKSKKLVNIYMVEKEVTNTTGVTVPHSKTVLTKKTAHLYDKNGKEVTNRALGVNSGWKSDQMMVLNGETYYRVATNEYVKVSDIVEYQMNVSTVKTTSGSAKYLYDVNGKKSSDRALAANTAWFTDKAAVINGEKMYRVATNEWVKASDID